MSTSRLFMWTALFTLLSPLFSPSVALNEHVTDLTPSNFKDKVLESDRVWIVEFYAPWCGQEYQPFAPEFSKFVEALTPFRDVVSIGVVNAEKHLSLAAENGAMTFPTFKVFGLNKHSPNEYQSLVEAAENELKMMYHFKLVSMKSDGSGQDYSQGLVELTDSNFKEKVLDSDDMWLVEFFAPECPLCIKLEPHWSAAATELEGEVMLGAVDSTVHSNISSRYNVTDYPTIKFFPAGKKDGTAKEYDGGLTSSDIITWALDKLYPMPEVKQLTSVEDMKVACGERQLCVVSILPNIYDCQSQCRNDFLSILKTVSKKYKRNRWGWIWTEALAQPELEDALGIDGVAYPAMAALDARKMEYSLLMGSFTNEGISEFLREVSVGRGSSYSVKDVYVPSIIKTEPWDGKDGQLPVVEVIDLSDSEKPSHSEL